jgi:hypothetical protein
VTVRTSLWRVASMMRVNSTSRSAAVVTNPARRLCAGRRDHRELMPEDYVVLRPGPNFDWLMGNLVAD